MDPYRILGVSRKCTREAVKSAFRARVWQAHPDRGGDAGAFIQICAAYTRILEELERSPRPGGPNPAQAPRRARPAAPPEPPWNPELILLDEPPGWNVPPVPPDPNWKPDLILLDHAPPANHGREPVSPKASRKTYRSWLRRVAARTQARRSIRRSEWYRRLGVVILLGLIGGNLWMLWLAWTYDPQDPARAAEVRARAAAGPQGGRLVMPIGPAAEFPASPRSGY